MIKTKLIAKGKCFGSLARQPDSLVILEYPCYNTTTCMEHLIDSTCVDGFCVCNEGYHRNGDMCFPGIA